MVFVLLQLLSVILKSYLTNSCNGAKFCQTYCKNYRSYIAKYSVNAKMQITFLSVFDDKKNLILLFSLQSEFCEKPNLPFGYTLVLFELYERPL